VAGASGQRGVEENPARLVSRGETFRQELLAQAHQRTGDSRVSKLKIETE
jgi:hypothetical protein